MRGREGKTLSKGSFAVILSYFPTSAVVLRSGKNIYNYELLGMSEYNQINILLRIVTFNGSLSPKVKHYSSSIRESYSDNNLQASHPKLSSM